MSTIDTTNVARRRSKAVLTVGYLVLVIAVLGAYLSPAQEYEVSIYQGTPMVFWLGLGVTMLVSLFVSFYAPRGYLSTAGLVLGGLSMVSVLSLPLMRGYSFLGTGDSMTHLGWVRDILEGTLHPLGLFYPGLHTVSIFFYEVVGLSQKRSVMFFVVCMFLVFLVFIPLCVRAISGQDGAMLIGVFAAFLLLPINQVATHISAHPITDAVLFSPVLLYLLVQFLLATPNAFGARQGAFGSIPTVGVLLALASIAIVVYHPQQAANTILLFATISAVQFACRRYGFGDRIHEHRPLYGQTTLLVAVFFLWAFPRERFVRAFGTILGEVAGFFLGGSDDAAAIVQQRGGSLSAIGASTTELFLKMFFVSALFAALVALLMLISLLGDNEEFDPDTTGLLRYFSVGLIVLVPYSFAFFIGVASNLFFRNLGFIMVITTILGAIAIYRYVAVLSEIVAPERIRLATVAVLGFMIVLSAAVYFPSPYMYQASGHVTDERFDGHEAAFEHQAVEVGIYSVRSGPWRFRNAIVGVEGVDSSRNDQQGYYGTNLTDVRTLSGEDRYFIYSKADVVRETNIFNGLRFTEAQFNALDYQPGVHRIQANGDVYLYYIEGAGNNSTVGDRAAVATPTTSPAPTTTPTATPSPTPTPTATPSPTPTPTATPSPTPTPTSTNESGAGTGPGGGPGGDEPSDVVDDGVTGSGGSEGGNGDGIEGTGPSGENGPGPG